MGFKDMVKADNAAVFLNTEEFAEFHTIKYDGETYSHIPVLLQRIKETDKGYLTTDKIAGVYKVSAKLYINLRDIDNIIPERGRRISIDNGEAVGNTFFDDYKIVTSSPEEGMVILELELFDE